MENMENVESIEVVNYFNAEKRSNGGIISHAERFNSDLRRLSLPLRRMKTAEGSPHSKHTQLTVIVFGWLLRSHFSLRNGSESHNQIGVNNKLRSSHKNSASLLLCVKKLATLEWLDGGRWLATGCWLGGPKVSLSTTASVSGKAGFRVAALPRFRGKSKIAVKLIKHQ